jgi:hypothetical protein
VVHVAFSCPPVVCEHHWFAEVRLVPNLLGVHAALQDRKKSNVPVSVSDTLCKGLATHHAETYACTEQYACTCGTTGQQHIGGRHIASGERWHNY